MTLFITTPKYKKPHLLNKSFQSCYEDSFSLSMNVRSACLFWNIAYFQVFGNSFWEDFFLGEINHIHRVVPVWCLQKARSKTGLLCDLRCLLRREAIAVEPPRFFEMRAYCLRAFAGSIPEGQRMIDHKFKNLSFHYLFGGRSRHCSWEEIKAGTSTACHLLLVFFFRRRVSEGLWFYIRAFLYHSTMIRNYTLVNDKGCWL